MLVLYGFLRMVPSPYSEKHILSWNVSKVNPKLPLGSGFLPLCPVARRSATAEPSAVSLPNRPSLYRTGDRHAG